MEHNSFPIETVFWCSGQVFSPLFWLNLRQRLLFMSKSSSNMSSESLQFRIQRISLLYTKVDMRENLSLWVNIWEQIMPPCLFKTGWRWPQILLIRQQNEFLPMNAEWMQENVLSMPLLSARALLSRKAAPVPLGGMVQLNNPVRSSKLSYWILLAQ